MPANRNKRSVPSSLGDKANTFVQWGLLSMEALRLKCNQYSLAANRKKVNLQRRLVAHFAHNRDPESESSAPESTTVSTKATATSNTEILTELQHLRNEITTLKSNFHHHQQQMTVETDRPTRTTTTRFSAPGPLTNSCDFNFDPEPPITQTQNGGGAGLGFQEVMAGNRQGNFNNSFNNVNDITNPYTPPPIKSSMLNKVEKQEYIDFDELLPPLLELDANSSSILIKPKKPKCKICDFASWMCAWNIFTQAYLFYHPSMQFNLFAYLKIFSNLVRKFKFDNCYAYDKAQRIQLSSQTLAPIHNHTTSWQQQNEELFNLYLGDNYLPACFYCNTYGHYATSCPFKSPTTFQNGFRNAPPHPTFTILLHFIQNNW